MLVEIRRAGFVNKGAQLMVRAIAAAMDGRYEDVRYAMVPNSVSAPYQLRAYNGFYQKASYYSRRVQWGGIAGLIPPGVRNSYGIVLDRELDLVLDAAGFAYGDQWGVGNLRELAQAAGRWKARGTKSVLLPQAFGPFILPKAENFVRKIAESVDLMFVRDPVSWNHVISITGERPNIFMAPDFTNLLQGTLPGYADELKDGVCIVPNYRMVDRTSRAVSDAYLPFLVRAAAYLKEHNHHPFILLHEGEKDRMLARRLCEAVPGVPLIEEPEALNVKGIIGGCRAMIGNRFHGLVSALSQGVPALSAGWSHKYEMLFRDYGYEEGIADITDTSISVETLIERMLDKKQWKTAHEKLLLESSRLKTLSEEMWQKVFALIDG